MRPTLEKPLTTIDYIAALEQCVSIAEVQRYAGDLPLWVREDERFTKAVAKRLAAIKSNQRRESA